jgi:YggT family protein
MEIRPHGRLPMNALFWLIDEVLWLYFWAVILSAVINNLIAFNVLDTRNRFVWTLSDFFYRLTEPALRPIRSVLPNFGGIDISPIVLILIIQALRMLLAGLYQSVYTGHGLY